MTGGAINIVFMPETFPMPFLAQLALAPLKHAKAEQLK